jgi:hypothetical protein
VTTSTSSAGTAYGDGDGGASVARGGRAAPGNTGSPASRVLGVLALGSVALLVLYGLVWSPPDAEMAD